MGNWRRLREVTGAWPEVCGVLDTRVNLPLFCLPVNPHTLLKLFSEQRYHVASNMAAKHLLGQGFGSFGVGLFPPQLDIQLAVQVR